MAQFFQEAFVGLWPLVWKFGVGGVIIIGCLAAYFLMPAPVATMFPNLRKFLLWAAGVVAIIFVSYAAGVTDEHHRAVAQNKIAVQIAVAAGDKARDDAVEQVKREMAAEKRDAEIPATIGPKPWISAPKRVRKPDPYNRYPK